MHTGLPAAQADLHQLAERRHIHVRPGRRDGPPPGAGADLLHLPGASASAPVACGLLAGPEHRPESDGVAGMHAKVHAPHADCKATVVQVDMTWSGHVHVFGAPCLRVHPTRPSHHQLCKTH